MSFYVSRSVFVLLCLLLCSPVIAGQNGLELLESVLYGIKNQPSVLLQQQQVESAQGAYQIQSAPFDYQTTISAGQLHDNTPLTGIARRIVDIPRVQTDISQYDLIVSKELRSGIVISPNLQMIRTDDNLFNVTSPNQASANVLFQFPLMKGRGVSSTGAPEQAARHDYDAAVLEQRQEIARTILNTTLAYWTYRAAAQNLRIAQESEQRAGKMMDQTKSLIDAKEVAAAEIKQLEANAAGKAAQTSAAEQDLIEARQNLGLVMGMPADEILSLPLPSDDFPSPPIEQANFSSPSDLVDMALKSRPDLFALRKRQESADLLQVAASRDLKPAFNLDLNFGYAGLNEGGGFSRLFSPFTENIAGLNASASIQYTWPVRNSFALGNLAQRTSEKKQAAIRSDDLIRRITSAVRVAYAAVQNSSIEVQQSQNAVAAFNVALDNEEQKLQLGLSTLLDTINMEEKLTTAERNRTQAQLRYASAVIQLSFETGSLVSNDSREISVDATKLINPPLPR